MPTRDNAGDMIRRLLLAATAIGVALVGTVAILYLLNAPPRVPTVSAADAAASSKPYVVKLHAQWCPYCILTKDEWSQIERTYAGRVHLVVLDFTSEAATERSRAEAERLNLGRFFDEYVGATGIVVVLDGRTLEVTAEIGGHDASDVVIRLRDEAINVSATVREYAVLDMDRKQAMTAVRLSPHYYNTPQELNLAVSALQEFAPQMAR